jgi:DNA-binding GntR family transcriptional regulator
MDPSASPTTVRQLAVHKLRNAILSGELRPGTKLVENDLCAMLGVSRPSVREALLSLAGEQLITMIPNRGPFVSALDWREAEEIYHVRELLEGEAAALCCSHIDDAQLARMSEALDAFEAAVLSDDADRRVSSTTLFYDLMLHSCGNRVIEQMLTGLQARVTFLRERSMSSPGRGISSLHEMRDIYEAIAARVPKRARAAAASHVRHAARVAKDVMLAGT